MRRDLFLCTLTFLAALIAARLGESSALLYLCLGGGAAALFLLLKLRGLPLGLCLLALVFAAGFFYGEWRESLLPQSPLAAQEEYTLTGMAAKRPSDHANSQSFDLEVRTIDGQPVDKPFKIAVTAPKEAAVAYGDLLQLTGSTFAGSVPKNPGQFDYSANLADQGVLASFSCLYGGSVTAIGGNDGQWLMKIAYSLRERFEQALGYLPADQQALISGIFFGDKGGLEPAVKKNLQRSGLMHAFAVSGLHVGYVILFISALCALLHIRRWWRFGVIAVVLLFYCAMTGFTPSVLRATIMGLVVLVAVNLGRERDGLTALAIAALLLLLIEPRALVQIGFQLSFAAMFGILWFSPFFERLITPKFPLKGALIVMLGAQLGVTPLLIYYFHLFSIVSLLISVAGCLIVGGIVILCLPAMLLSLIAPLPAAILLYSAGFLADAVYLLIRAGVALPFAYRYIAAAPVWQIVLVYACLIPIPVLPALRFRRGLSALLMTFVLAVFLLPFSLTPRVLTVTHLAVGDANCVSIETPSGYQMLIDAGGNATHTIEPYLAARGVDRLDIIVNSHPDRDHCEGIPDLLADYPCNGLVITAPASEQADSLPLIAAAKAQGVDVYKAAAGETLLLSDGITLEILWPQADAYGSSNDQSFVLRLCYGETAFLFTGDIGSAVADSLAASTDVAADVLELPHHGAEGSFSPTLYAAVAPDYVVIDTNGKNGHPAEAVLAYWQARHIPVLRTDEDGAVSFRSDGRTVTAETFLRSP